MVRSGDGDRMTTRRTRTDWSAAAPFRFAVGIEDTFIPQERVGKRRLDEYELTQHYQFWREDLDLVARSGADSLRWGIPWYRVEPEPGRFEWDWVDRVVDHITELGLTCIVDLMHYGTPLWMTESFLDPDYPSRVAAYAAAAATRYGDRLDVWTPLNEPNVNADFCGRRGVWPPYLTGEDGFVALSVALAEGIVATQRAILDVQPDASFVYVEAAFRYVGDSFPIPRGDPRRAAVRGARPRPRPCRRRPSDPRLARPPRRRLGAARPPDRDGAPGRPRGQLLPGLPTCASTTPARPSGSRPAPTASTSSRGPTPHRYDLPLMITETSRGGALEDRRAWLRESLAAVAVAARRGHPARRLHVVPVHRPHRLGLPRSDDAARRLDRPDGNGRPPSRSRRRRTRTPPDGATRRLRRGSTAGNTRTMRSTEFDHE